MNQCDKIAVIPVLCFFVLAECTRSLILLEAERADGRMTCLLARGESSDEGGGGLLRDVGAELGPALGLDPEGGDEVAFNLEEAGPDHDGDGQVAIFCGVWRQAKDGIK